MTPITVTPAGIACLSPLAARVKTEVEAKAVSLAHPLVLARIKLNPVPKGTMK